MFCNSRAPAAEPCAPDSHGRGGGTYEEGKRGGGKGKRRGENGEKPAHLLRRPSGPSRGAARDAAPLPPAGTATGSGRGPGEEEGGGGGPGATPARRTARPGPARPAPGCSAAAGIAMEPVRVPGPGPTAAQPGRDRAAPLRFLPEFNKAGWNYCLERWERAGEQQSPPQVCWRAREVLGAAPIPAGHGHGDSPARASRWKSSCGFS